jgi:hypothetical protein
MASRPPAANLPKPPPAHPLRCYPAPKEAGRWFRVHQWDPDTGRSGPTAFNDTGQGNARFSPLVDPATGGVIPTLYAARSPRGAIAEIVLHDAPTPSTGYLHDWERDKASRLHLSEIELPSLQLVNLSTTGLRAAGLQLGDLFGTEKPDYPRTREWALWTWQNLPQAQGLHWMSVRDNTSEVVMLFGDRVAPSAVRLAAEPTPIARYESTVLHLLDELGAGLLLA